MKEHNSTAYKGLEFYKTNAEENYITTPISVLRYVSKQEEAQDKLLEFLHSEITERRDYSASKMCEKVIEFINNTK